MQHTDHETVWRDNFLRFTSETNGIMRALVTVTLRAGLGSKPGRDTECTTMIHRSPQFLQANAGNVS